MNPQLISREMPRIATVRMPPRAHGHIFPCALAVLTLVLTMVTGQAQTFTVLKSFGFITNVTGYNPPSTVVRGPDGTLYGATYSGEGSVAGTVFKVQSDGSGFSVLKWFTNSIEGTHPSASLTLSGSTLYGTTYLGGTSNFGTVFKVNTDGTGYAVLKRFDGGDGANPAYAGLTLSGTTLYGTTPYGGSSSYGTLFKLSTDGTGYTVLKHFTGSNGASPNASLTLSGSVLYGTAESGGSSGVGTVFKINTDGTGYALLHNFTNSPDGAYPDGVLTLSGSTLYGTTFNGGASFGNAGGTVFKVNTDGTGYAVLTRFDLANDGYNPAGTLALSGSVLFGTTGRGGSSGNGTLFGIHTDGTGYSVLINFAWTNGSFPLGLTLAGDVLFGCTTYGGADPRAVGAVYRVNTNGTGHALLKTFVSDSTSEGSYASPTLSDGVLYATTWGGGSSNLGTVFRMNTDGSGYAVLKNFSSNDGANSAAGLRLSGSTLYGTTYRGGASNYGTVFKVNTGGSAYVLLKDFTNSSDGVKPSAGLTLSGGTLYGTTYQGGSSNYGTVFQVNTDGTGYTVLKNFNSIDGANPLAGLALAGTTLYGTTMVGGNFGFGTIFRLNTDGTGFTVLKHFASTNGAYPGADLTLSGTTLYGTAQFGGSPGDVTAFSGFGVVFKLNTDGTGYTVLKSFTSSDGEDPAAELTLFGNTLYGTTYFGGSAGQGTVFKLNTDGTGYTVLKHFASSDGANPLGGVMLSGTMLYGTTIGGGFLDKGLIFSLGLAVPPLRIISIPGNVILSWPDPAFSLQSAAEVIGVYTNVPIATSPYTNPITGPQQFFRLSQ